MISIIISKIKKYYGTLLDYVTIIKNFIENYIFRYFFQYLSIATLLLFITMKKGTNIIFINSITNDSIFSAIDFINDIMQTNYYVIEYVAPFINNMKVKTHLSFLDRYLYYAILQICSIVLNILFWNNLNLAIYFILILSTHPYFLEKIIEFGPIKKIMDFFRKKVNSLIKHIILSLYAYSFNNICISILNKNPKVTSGELKYLHKKRSYSHLIDFLKIFLISLLIQYMESVGSIYTRLIKMLYNYGALIEIKSQYNEIDHYEDIKDDKQKIMLIIEKRDWRLFFNPKILKIIIKLYRESQGESILEKLKNNIKYMELIVGKFFAFYSVSVLLDMPYVSFILSVLLCYMNNLSLSYYIPRILSIFAWYLDCSALYVTAISELIELMDNKVTHHALKKIKEKIYENRFILVHHNNFNYDIILNSIICFTIFNTIHDSYWGTVVILLISSINKNIYIGLYIGILGWFSNYHIMQLLSIGLILYLGLNIYHYKTIPKRNITKDIIHSYINTVNNNINKEIENINDNSVIIKKYEVKSESVDNYMNDTIQLNKSIIDTNKSFLNNGIIISKNSTLTKSFESYKKNQELKIKKKSLDCKN